MTITERHASSPPPTSFGLLELAKSSEPLAWQTISRVYAPLVYSWARRTGVRHCDASDVTQEVFLKIFLKLDTYQPGRGRFRDWLWRITRNTVIELLRNQRRRPVPMDPTFLETLPKLLDLEPTDVAPDHLPNSVLRRALEVIRPRVKELTYQAAWRTLALDLAPTDVAHSLGLSLTAVYIAKSRVLKELRRILAGLEF